MSYDTMWELAARDWLEGAELSESIVDRWTPKLAQQLQDVAEQCVDSDIPEDEAARAESAHGEHIDRLIDEGQS